MDQPTLDVLEEKETNPLTIIRTETALSRFPVHRLSKKGIVQIEIKNQSSALYWEVTYNSKYGQPGPLAYRLDTLIINRRIEEARRPVPEIIKLGSLSQIAAELGLNRDTNSAKIALLQNAFASIKAKIAYRTIEGAERTLEAAFTRYDVVFTGEQLPGGANADAVYLVLHRVYADVLNSAVTRPLDYDYMRELPPAAQRFYEIVSYQIYAALHFQNERARLRYSEYCLLSTATRYFDFDHVKKQMYKVHKPHIVSGYLGPKIGFEGTTDAEGQPDWWMYYVPGPNAAREYREFTGIGRKSRKAERRRIHDPENARSLFLPVREEKESVSPPLALPEPAQEPEPDTLSPEREPLLQALVAAGMNPPDAHRLVQADPEECRRQLEYLPYHTRLENPGGWLRKAIEGQFAAPEGFKAVKARADQERKRREALSMQNAVQSAQEARRAQIVAEAVTLLDRSKKSASEANLASLNAFEEYYARERSRRVDAVKSARLKETMETIWGSDAKRAEIFLLFFAEV
ncbi:MAG: hypothetical protein WCP07_06780, partial [bacterium]